MGESIYPIIFFPLKKDGLGMYNAILQSSATLSKGLSKRFLREIKFTEDNKLLSTIGAEELILELPLDGYKRDSYLMVHKNRTAYAAAFERSLNDIYNLENNNYALEHDINLAKPQIIVLASIDIPELSPLIAPLLQIADSLPQAPNIHLFLLYNQELDREDSKNASLLKVVFLKEIEDLKAHRPYIWLIDIINEQGINLVNNNNLNYSIAQFTDLILTNAGRIKPAIYNEGFEQGKACQYSSFGFSQLSLPIEKMTDYMLNHAYKRELGKLESRFNEKFQVISIKDEISSFFRGCGFKEIPEKLSKNQKLQPIYTHFTFREDILTGSEKEAVLSKNLSRIESPQTLSKTTSSHLFSRIDEAENNYIQTYFTNFSGQLDDAKKRELNNATNCIAEAQANLMDKQTRGINYALLFVTVLGNNQSASDKLLEGRFTSDVPTIVTLEDSFRGLFIGDQVAQLEKKLREASNNYSHNKKRIEQNENKIKIAQTDLIELQENVGEENSNYIELDIKIKAWDETNLALSIENAEYNREIQDLTYQLEQIKSEFDADATKESFKLKLNESLKEEIKDIRDTKIRDIDNQLSSKYEQKNTIISTRKKMLFRNVFLIPAIILLASILMQGILFKSTSWFEGIYFGKSLLITLIILIFYYLYSSVLFLRLRRKLKDLLGEVDDLLTAKNNFFSKYVNLKNNVFENDFNFEKNLIAFFMAKDLIEVANNCQRKTEDFKKSILNELNRVSQEKEQILFSNSASEYSIVDKGEIERIYDTSYKNEIFPVSDNARLSECYKSFVKNNNLESMFAPIRKQAEDLASRKINNETLKRLLFNESDTFVSEVNTNAKFQQIINTSRPLLKTKFWPNLSTSDVPYVENIIVGYKDQTYDAYLKELKISDLNIAENNEMIFGLLSIKSNFPAFLIYDTEENEESLRNELTSDNLDQLFINESSSKKMLIPDMFEGEIDEHGNKILTSELIVVLVNKIIEFDTERSKFIHSDFGDAGINLDAVIINWDLPIFAEAKQDAQKLTDEIWHYEEEERVEFLTEFKQFWKQFPIGIPLKHEDSLSEFYFSLKGSEKEWNDIKQAIKTKRKSERSMR
jgi:hypothetical protein